MESEQMMAVFSELLDNQKEILAMQKELMDTFRELNNQMEVIASGLQNQKGKVVQVDLKSIQQAMERCIADIRLSVQTQLQKQDSNNWRIFLESDAKKWAVILVVAVTFLTYLYWFVKH